MPPCKTADFNMSGANLRPLCCTRGVGALGYRAAFNPGHPNPDWIRDAHIPPYAPAEYQHLHILDGVGGALAALVLIPGLFRNFPRGFLLASSHAKRYRLFAVAREGKITKRHGEGMHAA
jgi:hypothetical protein